MTKINVEAEELAYPIIYNINHYCNRIDRCLKKELSTFDSETSLTIVSMLGGLQRAYLAMLEVGSTVSQLETGVDTIVKSYWSNIEYYSEFFWEEELLDISREILYDLYTTISLIKFREEERIKWQKKKI